MLHITGQKISVILVASISMLGAVVLLYPTAVRVYDRATAPVRFVYTQNAPIVSEVDLSGKTSPRAVPMLMYHGIVEDIDAENTNIEKFISQMEMLKKEGYQTISIAEMDQAFQGTLALPPKPIIITFDDGRRDSYYPADHILETLGFKATIFVATERANHNDTFYLSWDELKTLSESGRWEIEAHGRNSHDRITIDENGEQGRYLTALRYIPGKGIETPAEFEARIEQDYKNGIDDITQHIGKTPRYFAVPLNDYGQEPVSYVPSTEINERLTKSYFRFAFIEANDYENVTNVARSFYNYASDDPYRLRRLEVKNMDADTLMRILNEWAPQEPKLTLSKNNPDAFKARAQLLYGTSTVDEQGVHLYSTKEDPSAVLVFGDVHWQTYSVTASAKRIRGQSIVVLGNYRDKENFVAYGITDNGIFLRETIRGKTKEWYSSSPIAYTNGQEVWFTLALEKGNATGYLNGERLFTGIPITSSEGKVGFKVWDTAGAGEGVFGALYVKPLL